MPGDLTKERKVKSPKPPKKYERLFAEFATYMIEAMTEQYINGTMKSMNKKTVKKFEDAQTGNYAKIFQGLDSKTRRKLIKRFSNKRIDAFVKDILLKVDRRNQSLLYQTASESIGIDPKQLTFSEGLTPQINALIAETQEWTKKLRDETLSNYSANALRAMAEGRTLDDVIAEIGNIKSKRKNAAKLTARTQVATFNGLATKLRAQKLGAKKAMWVTANDERVRKCHEVRDGKEFDLDKGLYSSCDNKTLYPGTDYNCFPGDSELNYTSFCKKLYRRFYSGELTELVFSDGVILRATPNHPIFTRDGFKAIKDIDFTDYIVRSSEECINSPELDTERYVPTFEEIFTSFDNLGVEKSVSPGISGKFHGDMTDSEIDIIALDRLLADKINPTLLEKISKFGFTESDKVVILTFMTCNSHFAPGFDGLGLTSDGLMSLFDLVSSFVRSHLTPLELFGFALGSWGDAVFNNDSANNVSADTKMFSDCVFAFSTLIHGADFYLGHINSLRTFGCFKPMLAKMGAKGDIIYSQPRGSILDCHAIGYKFDSVINKRTVDFCGHIYNLETDSNDYITQTTAVSNCRCTYNIVLDDNTQE